MYDEAYKVYQSILAKIPTENTDTPMKKIGGLLGRSITKEEKRPMEPVRSYSTLCCKNTKR